MKANELRIESLVRLKASGEIVRVERISRKKVGFFRNGDKSRGYFRKYSEIEGVLIFDHWRKIDCRDFCWRGESEEDDVYIYYTGGRDLEIRYIHELQNLHFALTGEEIKIDI